MNWQPIETAPKDGTYIVLWCMASNYLLLECKWDNGCWKDRCSDDNGNMVWWKLEMNEIPTHWMKIVPPTE